MHSWPFSTGRAARASSPPAPPGFFRALPLRKPRGRHPGISTGPSPMHGDGSASIARGTASMFTFAYPWLALLLPLPWFVYRFAPPHARPRAGLRVPFFKTLLSLTGQVPESGTITARRGAGRMAVLILCWVLSLAALMRPQWIEPPLHRDLPTRDMLLVVDLSASMDTKDFVNAQGQTVDRLAALKAVLDSFVARR